MKLADPTSGAGLAVSPAHVETVQPWTPTRFSPPLSTGFTSDGDWLLELLALVWRDPGGELIELDEWQAWLIRAILETYPPGHPRAGELRYRQVVVSVGRQNGKSLLAAALALYGLIRQAGALVIGLASTAEQARIIYDRLLSVVRSDASLRRRFNRMTDTRGIRSTDGSRYEIKASKSAAVQGLAIDVALLDELHIVQASLWADMVNGAGGRPNTLVVGITTAGDANSVLLLDLYKQMDTADPSERFGYFVWEASQAAVPEDPAELRAELRAANPAVACGRIDVETVVADVAAQSAPDVIRYRLNRFLSSTTAEFLPTTMWSPCAGEMKSGHRPVFTVEMLPDRSTAFIASGWRSLDDPEVIYTRIEEQLKWPTTDQLVEACLRLQPRGPLLYATDSRALRPVMDDLKARGLSAKCSTISELVAAGALLFGKVAHRRVIHPGDDAVTLQLPRAVRKNDREGFKIVPATAGAPIAAVVATTMAVYFADVMSPEVPMQMFT